MKRVAISILMAVVLLVSASAMGITAMAETETLTGQTVKQDAGSIRLKVGGQADLNAILMFGDEDKEIQVVGEKKWSSNKPQVVSVDASGKVTANRIGTATISVTYMDNRVNQITQHMRVKVVSGETEKSAQYITVEEGKFLDLRELLFSDYTEGGGYGKITWGTNREHIVSVDEQGLATAFRHGTAKVTASHTDVQGNVTTQEVEIRVASMDLSNPFKEISITLDLGDSVDARKVFHPNYTNARTYGSIACTTSNPSVVDVKDGLVLQAKSSGSCTITMTYTDLDDEEHRQSITVKVRSE